MRCVQSTNTASHSKYIALDLTQLNEAYNKILSSQEWNPDGPTTKKRRKLKNTAITNLNVMILSSAFSKEFPSEAAKVPHRDVRMFRHAPQRNLALGQLGEGSPVADGLKGDTYMKSRHTEGEEEGSENNTIFRTISTR